MTKLYLSGPMQGIVDHNYPAFEKARTMLRKGGYDVVCPAELGQVDGYEWSDYLKRDIVLMVKCDGVATLSDWQISKGASLEVYIAHKLDMTVETVEMWLSMTWTSSR